jgi:hypothetical protein
MLVMPMPNQGIDELDSFLDKVIKPRFLTYSRLFLGDGILNIAVKSPNNPDWNDVNTPISSLTAWLFSKHIQ